MENDNLLKNRILEEMSVNYANALEKNFEEAKKWIRITSTGTVDLLRREGLTGTEEVLWYLIGKKYAQEAGLSEQDSVSNQELCDELGKKIGSILPWVKTLRDAGYLETIQKEHRIKINLIEHFLKELSQKEQGISKTSIIKTGARNNATNNRKIKPQGKVPAIIPFDVAKTSTKPSLKEFLESHGNSNVHNDVISCIGYYFKHFLNKDEFSEGQARYAYEHLRKSIPRHFHQAFIDAKTKRIYLENGSEQDSWKISYDGELHVEKDLKKYDSPQEEYSET